MTLPRYAASSRRLSAMAVVGLLLAGCGSSSVTVSPDFPTPLVEPLPLRVGLILDDELRQFEHFEELPRQSSWTIRLGDANVAFLTPIFETMFAETTSVTEASFAQALGGLDGVIRPKVDVFEFEVPFGRDSAEEFVEVWIQYSVELYDRSGELIIEWPVSGYGKAAISRGREQTLNRAATIAMRDAGAAIITRFTQQPQVSDWVVERTNDSTLSVGAQLAN